MHTSRAAFRIPFPDVSADSSDLTFKDFSKSLPAVGERGELQKIGARTCDVELEDDAAVPVDLGEDDGDAAGVSWVAALETAFDPDDPHHL